jgi:small subunit ribosomal protein S17
MEQQNKKQNTRIGFVTSDKMNKSVLVAVDRLVKHPLYGKTLRRTKKFMAHDEENQCKIGDKVKIEETRPMSKRKRWKVCEVLEKAKV